MIVVTIYFSIFAPDNTIYSSYNISFLRRKDIKKEEYNNKYN